MRIMTELLPMTVTTTVTITTKALMLLATADMVSGFCATPPPGISRYCAFERTVGAGTTHSEIKHNQHNSQRNHTIASVVVSRV